jgi:hypothetical protein
VSTYVTNVDVSAAPTSSAEAAAAEVARLGRLIANLNEHAALCEHPTVNRALQAVELRQHAAELESHRQALSARIAAGEFTANAEDDEAPLVMPSMFDDAARRSSPLQSTDGDDEGYLTMPQMQY